METNALYYGDNLDILRRYVPDGAVDLIYLDPPFNSNRDYNVIFRDESGNRSDAQLLAFEDTWHWGPSAESTYRYLTNTAHHMGRVPDKVSTIIAALRSGIGENQMLAYLVEMAVRLVELHRVLKPTGSLYLHCDPTASHYLKLLLDAIFDVRNFRNEIIWQRSSAHSDTTQGAVHLGRIHDTLLFYSRSQNPKRNIVFLPFTEEYTRTHYRYAEAGTGRRFRKGDLTAAKPGGDTRYEWTAPDGRKVRPYPGRYWAYSKDKMAQFEADGRLIYTKSGMPEYKRYLDEMPGQPAQDIWTDIAPINSQAKDRLGWATQKPVDLLARIIAISSDPGDLVLDPFCGCGTATVAAQMLGRRWIGIDITYLSIAVMKARLRDSFGIDVPVIGQPTEVEGARQLAIAADGRYQFQWWALNLIDARPLGGTEKKGSDRGIDGRITFTTGPRGEMGQALVSVKSGHVNSSMIRDLKGTIEREKAEIGVFITLDEPSREMLLEATTGGFYSSPISGKDYPRIQILTIRELLDEHKKPELPLLILSPFQQAERLATQIAAGQQTFFGGDSETDPREGSGR